MKKHLAVLIAGFLVICGYLWAYQSIRTLKSELRASQQALIVMETSEKFLREQGEKKDEKFSTAQSIIGYMTNLAVELDSIFLAWQDMSIEYDQYARANCVTYDGVRFGRIYDSYKYGSIIEKSKAINARYESAQANVGEFLELLKTIEEPDDTTES